MIITLVGMNVIAVLGLFAGDKQQASLISSDSADVFSQEPGLKFTAKPGTVQAGGTATLSWSTTGNPTHCSASGAWKGVKTPYGAESTGRLKNPGKYKFTLICKNDNGSAKAAVVVKVNKGKVVAQSSSSSSSSSSSGPSAGSSYCGGRIPCYNAKEVGTHSSKGNCWGWLGDRVINISAFDSGFHKARSGVSNIELSAICGKNLQPAVSGNVSSSEYPGGHKHELGATSNTDKNYLAYFVGYFDSNKP